MMISGLGLTKRILGLISWGKMPGRPIQPNPPKVTCVYKISLSSFGCRNFWTASFTSHFFFSSLLTAESRLSFSWGPPITALQLSWGARKLTLSGCLCSHCCWGVERAVREGEREWSSLCVRPLDFYEGPSHPWRLRSTDPWRSSSSLTENRARCRLSVFLPLLASSFCSTPTHEVSCSLTLLSFYFANSFCRFPASYLDKRRRSSDLLQPRKKKKALVTD